MDRVCSAIFLLFIGGVIGGSREERLNVYLEPKYAEVCEGDSVTINCTFQPGGNYKLRWYYSATDLDCNSGTERLHKKWHNNKENNVNWSVFTINSIKTNDIGWYFCSVVRDIPVLDQKCSNGIQVLVDTNSTQEYPKQTQTLTQNLTTQDSPTTCLISATTIPTTSSTPPYSIAQWRIWLALAVGCVVLVVLIVVICILTRKPKEIIYENTKPVESSCWRQNRTKMEICDLPKSQKTDTIKPLRKYDTLSSNRIHRP
ncbi:uncharacterized protein [Sinocyclocheilus grahami]|uniref:uncharacterized protein isoform X2 n=1 Tax=Sinocyclocheilus grahami TaxID=75366 RepID=UPI0007ACDC14|nr:PREDICTED: uncharacterized protein LOC107560684 isoform X2 [Sinocyclocheilus grahami]